MWIVQRTSRLLVTSGPGYGSLEELLANRDRAMVN